MYLQKGHYTVKLIRQRETISFKPRRCVQMSARLHSLFRTKFRQVRKCLGQIKLKSNLPEILVLVVESELPRRHKCNDHH